MALTCNQFNAEHFVGYISGYIIQNSVQNYNLKDIKEYLHCT